MAYNRFFPALLAFAHRARAAAAMAARQAADIVRLVFVATVAPVGFRLANLLATPARIFAKPSGLRPLLPGFGVAAGAAVSGPAPKI